MLKSKTYTLLTCLAFSLTLSACQSSPQRPVLYPNNHLKNVGNEQGQRDIDNCIAMASNYGVQEKQDSKAGEKAVKGATIGAVTAGAWGLVRGGDAAERALAGAAAGAAGGAVAGAYDSQKLNPTYKKFVQRCLADQSYSVIGWQ